MSIGMQGIRGCGMRPRMNGGEGGNRTPHMKIEADRETARMIKKGY